VAETTEVDPNHGIGCNTIEDEVMITAEVRFGEARFEEVRSGCTRVDVTMNYSDAPTAAGEAVTNILPKPERNLKENLENLARNIERGDPGGPGADPSR
jgi:uncharacterized membrane protein